MTAVASIVFPDRIFRYSDGYQETESGVQSYANNKIKMINSHLAFIITGCWYDDLTRKLYELSDRTWGEPEAFTMAAFNLVF